MHRSPDSKFERDIHNYMSLQNRTKTFNKNNENNENEDLYLKINKDATEQGSTCNGFKSVQKTGVINDSCKSNNKNCQVNLVT